jgi:hypothetical protein
MAKMHNVSPLVDTPSGIIDLRAITLLSNVVTPDDNPALGGPTYGVCVGGQFVIVIPTAGQSLEDFRAERELIAQAWRDWVKSQ